VPKEVFVGAVATLGSIDQDRDPRRFEQIIGNSPALESVLEQVERVAPTDSTVLIQGETGTGKELVARAIHNLSARCGRPFIKLNCAAIPFDLLESELFGHERGAFTGAIAQKIGRFELADKGTLFLDEVGDIPPALQPKLLRVLQEQEFERLGSTRTHQVDVRLVAATNRNLVEMVKRNEFRSDLYYRLNVFPIPLPPLRERREDIPALVEHFVEIYARRMGKEIEHVPSETMSALVSYLWPGNIRELQNFIERSVILTSGNVLHPPLASLKSAAEAESLGPITLEDAERDHIRKILEETRWVVAGPNGAAARLGIKRSTLYFRMQKLGISRAKRDPLLS
jgi:formate hydrogenlyase transcriptional activator